MIEVERTILEDNKITDSVEYKLSKLLPPNSEVAIEHLLSVCNNELWDPMKDQYISLIIPMEKHLIDFELKIAKVMTFAEVVGRLNGPYKCNICGMTYDLICLSVKCCPKNFANFTEGMVKIDGSWTIKQMGRKLSHE